MTDDAKLFTTMQAIERARQRPEYEPGQLIGIYSRNTSEMGYLAQEDFGEALLELKKHGTLSIHSFPRDDNARFEFHFRVALKEKKFRALYLDLEKRHPQATDPRMVKRVLRYKGLEFNVNNGAFSYGSVRGTLRPCSEPWSALFILMTNKEQPVERSKIQAQIIASWNVKKSKKRQKRQGDIDIENVIKRLRRKLKMGEVKGATNPNLIHGDGQKNAYLLKAGR